MTSILTKEKWILSFFFSSRIVPPYCVMSRLPQRLDKSFLTPDSSLSGLRGEGRDDGSEDDTIAAGDECALWGKVAGVWTTRWMKSKLQSDRDSTVSEMRNYHWNPFSVFFPFHSLFAYFRLFPEGFFFFTLITIVSVKKKTTSFLDVSPFFLKKVQYKKESHISKDEWCYFAPCSY